MKKPQLFLLHFAGGNCYSFQFMTPLLKEFDVISLELPGRGRRMEEGLLTDFELAAEDIYRQIILKTGTAPFLIYGHSMGAYLGLRVTNMLEKAGKMPAFLLVSGNAGPGVPSDKVEKKRYLMDEEEFISELKTLGGVPGELLENEELFNFFEPILRADFEIAEEHGLSNEPAVQAPLFAMMGSAEEKADKLDNWGRFTKSRFSSEVLEGDHFFIFKHPQRIATIIKHCYGSVLVEQS